MQSNSNALLHRNARSDWVRLRTLMAIRWSAVVGQFVALMVAVRVLEVDLRLDLCVMVIVVSASVNVLAQLVAPANRRLSEGYTLGLLVFDMVQLALLLYLTGGLTNPFAVLLMAPVVVAATSLTLASTLIVCCLAVVLASLLALTYVPLKFVDGTVLTLPDIYLLGMWAALCVGTLFATLYVRRVTVESFSMSQALLATQMALDREQRLTALGGVVAAAAHELGTPLATIKLTASELRDDLQEHDLPAHVLEDIDLIAEQAERCRQIMRDMGRAGKDDTHLRTAPISALLEEAAEPHMDRGKQIVLRLNGACPQAQPPKDQPEVRRSAEVLHGLRNLVQNAVDFAHDTVWVDIYWTEDHIRIVVGDDGEGYPSDLIHRIGDPFVRRRKSAASDAERPGYEGMGLGLFIAKTLLERSGAELTFANAPADHLADDNPELASPSGAIVEVVWMRRKLEVGRDVTRGALGQNMPIR